MARQLTHAPDLFILSRVHNMSVARSVGVIYGRVAYFLILGRNTKLALSQEQILYEGF